MSVIPNPNYIAGNLPLATLTPFAASTPNPSGAAGQLFAGQIGLPSEIVGNLTGTPLIPGQQISFLIDSNQVSPYQVSFVGGLINLVYLMTLIRTSKVAYIPLFCGDALIQLQTGIDANPFAGSYTASLTSPNRLIIGTYVEYVDNKLVFVDSVNSYVIPFINPQVIDYIYQTLQGYAEESGVTTNLPDAILAFLTGPTLNGVPIPIYSSIIYERTTVTV